MKTIEVTKEEVINVLRLDLISEIQALKKSLELYEMKYGKSFKEFQKEVLEGEENFEKWDDYMEWKAYENTCKDRLSHLKDLKNAKNIRVITK
ncbi:MAG: hypothetical protein NG747_01855 [Candidatus Brocadia sp.]|nr:hypothetical protein [Candidatus Brocadia sp.]NUO08931.1 hypothetical protein [Candidatus Brocadia sp.]